jgi:hypothetical protein
MSNLAHRLEDIPGVASVNVDLTEEGGGINIRLDPEADEVEVMEKLRTVLIAYGVRSSRPESVEQALPEGGDESVPLGVRVTITPLDKGARVEVEGPKVRSFRVVAANPEAIAQGVADAWCRVVGKVPVEIVRVSIGDGGELTVTATDGLTETTGTADVGHGWESAVALAVGRAIGMVSAAPEQG